MEDGQRSGLAEEPKNEVMQAEPIEMPCETAESDAPKRPHSFREVLGYLVQFLRPGYHFRKIKEDVKASIHALRNRDLAVLKGDVDSLAHAVRGRLFATYFCVGPFGMLGPIAGAFFQYRIAQHWPFLSLMTFVVTVVIGNIFSAIGFQLIWAASARPIYRLKPPKFFDWLLLWKDILPLQWQGVKRWAGANVILFPICTLFLSMLDKFLPQVAQAVPIGVLTPAAEIIFVHASLIRLMGDLFEKESWRIAANHAHPEPLEG